MSVRPRADEAVIWHDVECGAYSADLAMWEELAGQAPGPALELGCGTGRVALALARAGHRVAGLDSEAVLLETLRERARDAGLEVATHLGDASGFDLGERFGLIIAPMQLAQLFDARGRAAMLAATARHLVPSGRVALAVAVEPPSPWRAGPGSPPPTPDVRELDGWVYSSLPLGVEAEVGAIAVRRLRQTVSPEGALDEQEEIVRLHELSPEALEREGRAHGLRPVDRHEIPPTTEHIGSVVVVLEASD